MCGGTGGKGAGASMRGALSGSALSASAWLASCFDCICQARSRAGCCATVTGADEQVVSNNTTGWPSKALLCIMTHPNQSSDVGHKVAQADTDEHA